MRGISISRVEGGNAEGGWGWGASFLLRGGMGRGGEVR